MIDIIYRYEKEDIRDLMLDTGCDYLTRDLTDSQLEELAEYLELEENLDLGNIFDIVEDWIYNAQERSY